MCKFENDNAPGFDLVVEGIQRYADQAPGIITGRWEAEKREGRVRRDADITEISRLYPGMWRSTLIWEGWTDVR